MNLTLRVWRQKNSTSPGGFVEYNADDISPDMSLSRCSTS
jgi:succinate dehydrogenase / fumarate reductase iron-sulfur subunit